MAERNSAGAGRAPGAWDRYIERRFFKRLIKRTKNFGTTTWLGNPIWQNVLDLWTIQETIAEVRPELLIETGTNRGGSSLFFAHLMDLMGGDGEVVTVDVEKMHSLSHPRVTHLIGSSVGDVVFGRIAEMAKDCRGPVMVILDSDHSAGHVEKELELYAPLVTKGSYCLVQDGVIDELKMFRGARPGPRAAVEKWLPRHPEFELDAERCGRFIVTHHPMGWLRRK